MEDWLHFVASFLGYFWCEFVIHLVDRYWCVEYKQISNVGLGYHQLRILGWYWSRRNFDFCGTVAFPSEMEDEY